jgi:hypothetical protein
VTTLLFSFSLTASLLSLSLFLMTMIAYLFWATLTTARNSVGGFYPFNTFSFCLTKEYETAN